LAIIQQPFGDFAINENIGNIFIRMRFNVDLGVRKGGLQRLD
jgi:hypothetical protein